MCFINFRPFEFYFEKSLASFVLIFSMIKCYFKIFMRWHFEQHNNMRGSFIFHSFIFEFVISGLCKHFTRLQKTSSKIMRTCLRILFCIYLETPKLWLIFLVNSSKRLCQLIHRVIFLAFSKTVRCYLN